MNAYFQGKQTANRTHVPGKVTLPISYFIYLEEQEDPFLWLLLDLVSMNFFLIQSFSFSLTFTNETGRCFARDFFNIKINIQNVKERKMYKSKKVFSKAKDHIFFLNRNNKLSKFKINKKVKRNNTGN